MHGTLLPPSALLKPEYLQNAWYTCATQCTVKTRVPKTVDGRRFKMGQNIDLFHTIYNIVPFSIQVGQKQVRFAVCFWSERGSKYKAFARKYTLWDLSATQTVSIVRAWSFCKSSLGMTSNSTLTSQVPSSRLWLKTKRKQLGWQRSRGFHVKLKAPPRYILTSFQPDQHFALCWLVECAVTRLSQSRYLTELILPHLTAAIITHCHWMYVVPYFKVLVRVCHSHSAAMF